jgi:hypothetical protein
MPYKDLKRQQEYNKDHKQYYRNKKLASQQTIKCLIASLKISCIKCNENYPAALDFHHRDKTEKEICVSDIVNFGWGEERIKKEIAKCDVLCANCHRKEHSSRSVT